MRPAGREQRHTRDERQAQDASVRVAAIAGRRSCGCAGWWPAVAMMKTTESSTDTSTPHRSRRRRPPSDGRTLQSVRMYGWA
jgi:hypothetical protein